MMRSFFLVLLLPAAANAAPPPPLDPFCAELQRIVYAACETPSFASLARAKNGPTLGFGRSCEVLDEDMGRRFICYRYMAPASLNRAALADATARCLPAAQRRADGELGDILFRLGGVHIRIEEHG